MLHNLQTTPLGIGANVGLFPAPQIRRLALVTDAWKPQTNGVVNTLVRLV